MNLDNARKNERPKEREKRFVENVRREGFRMGYL